MARAPSPSSIANSDASSCSSSTTGAWRPIDTARARDLLEILDDRIGRRSSSVVVTSQLPVADWHRQLNDPTLADAILDRLVHGAIRIELRGKSMRNDDAGAGTKA